MKNKQIYSSLTMAILLVLSLLPIISASKIEVHSDEFNYISLKEDINELTIPFAGGGGRAIKAGTRGADLIQTVDKANDVGRVASGTGKAISTVEKIGDVGRRADKINRTIKEIEI